MLLTAFSISAGSQSVPPAAWTAPIASALVSISCVPAQDVELAFHESAHLRYLAPWNVPPRNDPPAQHALDDLLIRLMPLYKF